MDSHEIQIVEVSAGMDRKEGNVLFNDVLSTFYINGYMASDMVKDQ